MLTPDVPGFLVSPVSPMSEWNFFISSSPSLRGAMYACYILLALSCLSLLSSVSPYPIQRSFTFVSMHLSVARSHITNPSSS